MTVADRLFDALLGVDAWLAHAAVPSRSGPVDPRSHEWTAGIRAALPAIRRELDEHLASGAPLPSTDEIAGAPQGGEGDWRTMVLTWYGRDVAATSSRFPATIAALSRVPALQGAGFTVLGPRAHLPRHQGPAHALRYLLGVRVPEADASCRFDVGGTACAWAPGVEVMFDDRTPHEAWNDGDEPRYLLFVQTRLPVPGLRGLAHRGTQRIYGWRTRGIARRAERYHAGRAPSVAKASP